jgi:large subunit ribosomal protein L7/L12
MTDINQLAEQLVNLSVKDVNELSSILKDIYGLEPAVTAAPITVTAPQGEAAAPAAQEKDSFTVVLKNAGATKLHVIKVVKEITGLGLKESKDLVDTPGKNIKENVSKSEEEDIKKRLVEAGAEVELK